MPDNCNRDPKNDTHIGQPTIHEEDPLGTAEAIPMQKKALQPPPPGRLTIITSGLPLPPGRVPPGTYHSYGPYGNPFVGPPVQPPQEITMQSSNRAPTLPRFHNIPGTFSVGNAGRGPNHEHRVENNPRGTGANLYNPNLVRVPGNRLNAESHDHFQQAYHNPNMFSSAINQGETNHMRGPHTPMNPCANGGGIPHPPYGQSTIEFRAHNNSRPAPGTAPSMAHTQNLHQHLAPRDLTPSISVPHGSNSRALVIRNNEPETTTGAMRPVGTSFRPSRMKLENDGLLESPARRNAGSNYLGDPTSRSYNAQETNLPDDENCALWITKLHPDVDLPGFLNIVRTGAVFACTINEPEGNMATKAAKLVFKTHEGAAAFLAKVNAGVEIAGQEIKAVWNRIGYRNNATNATRCLYIRADSNFRIGGALVMNEEFWKAFFKQCVVYELEGIRVWPNKPDGMTLIEARFARIDGRKFHSRLTLRQISMSPGSSSTYHKFMLTVRIEAEAIWHAIQKDPELVRHVEVGYAPDPCDPHSGWRA